MRPACGSNIPEYRGMEWLNGCGREHRKTKGMMGREQAELTSNQPGKWNI